MNLHDLTETLSRMLTAPLIPVEDTTSKRRIKLLSATLLLLICYSLSPLAMPAADDANYPSPPIYWTLISVLIPSAAYFLNRKGYFAFASRLTAVFLTLHPLLGVLLDVHPINDRHLFAAILPALVGGMLLTIGETLVIAVGNLSIWAVLILLTPELPPFLFMPPLAFYLLMASLTILFIYHRNRLEEERRRELQEQEERYRSLVENISEAIFSMNPRGEFTYISPAVERIWDFTPRELTGSHYSALFPPECHQQIETAIKKALAGKTSVIELKTSSKTGRPISIRGSIRPISERSQITGIAGVATDVTEHKKLEEELRQVQKMESVGRLAGGIAHDFNNLLTVIKGYCELLQNDHKMDGGQIATVSGIRIAAERGAALTQQLLAFSRKQTVAPEPLNLNIQVTGVRGMLERIIGEHITLATQLAPGLGNVSADANQLEQVIMNLAVNAADAMESGGQLTIETANIHLDEEYCRQYADLIPGDYIMLSVRDTGCGFDEKTAESIFEPFFTTKTCGKGTGLGLATVYGIIKQHNGHISFQSRPGAGSTFNIYLPETDEPIAPDIGPARDTGVITIGPAPNGATLMVVEDENGLREVIVQSLKEYGYHVLSAANGPAALEICSQLPDNTFVDLLVSDVVMPGLNGKELADRMKLRFPRLKVLLISGYAKKTILNQGIPLDNIKILMKPFSPKALAIQIREILANP